MAWTHLKNIVIRDHHLKHIVVWDITNQNCDLVPIKIIKQCKNAHTVCNKKNIGTWPWRLAIDPSEIRASCLERALFFWPLVRVVVLRNKHIIKGRSNLLKFTNQREMEALPHYITTSTYIDYIIKFCSMIPSSQWWLVTACLGPASSTRYCNGTLSRTLLVTGPWWTWWTPGQSRSSFCPEVPLSGWVNPDRWWKSVERETDFPLGCLDILDYYLLKKKAITSDYQLLPLKIEASPSFGSGPLCIVHKQGNTDTPKWPLETIISWNRSNETLFANNP